LADDPAQSHNQPELATTSTSMAEADAEELDARVAKELNNLFAELDEDKASAAPQLAGAVAVAASEPIAALVPPTPSPAPPMPSDPVAQAHELEKQLLGQTLMDVLGPTTEAQTGGGRSLNLSFLVRPLEWLNAPLAACSDTVRQTLGKVAIMTLINALAILLYVLFLRKH
jgi:hypothetical protein